MEAKYWNTQDVVKMANSFRSVVVYHERKGRLPERTRMNGKYWTEAKGKLAARIVMAYSNTMKKEQL